MKKQAMVKMVVFDMAGTTVDENNVVYKTLQKAINQFGYDVSLAQVLAHGAGKEKSQAIKDILREVASENDVGEKSKDIFATFLEMLEEAYAQLDVKTFDGTEQVFQYLHEKNVKVVLNTGYDRETATKLVKKLAWQVGKEYDLLVTATDVSNGRPHPDMILLAMGKMNVTDPSEVVKVGDSAIDIEEGKAAGCGLTLGITTGAQTAEQLKTASPDRIIDSLDYLRQLV